MPNRTAPTGPHVPNPPSALPPGDTVSTAGPVAPTLAVNSSAETQTVPEGLIPISWYATPGASATDSAMLRAGIAAALALVMPFRGSVVAIALSGTAAKAGGGAIFDVRKNGTKIPSCSLGWDNVQRAVARFAKGTFPFVRDDNIDVVFTTSGAYTPTTTGVDITLWVTQDTQEAI